MCVVVVDDVVVVCLFVFVFLFFQPLFSFCLLLDRFGVAKSNRCFNVIENVTVTQTSE